MHVSSPIAIALLQNMTQVAVCLIKHSISVAPQLLDLAQGDFLLFGSHLHLAVVQSDVTVVKQLLKVPGSSCEIVNQREETPLHVAILQVQAHPYAFMTRKLEIINTLIEAGCQLNSCDVYNWSPIHVAAKQTDQITANQSLLEWIIEKNQSMPPGRQFDL